MIDLPFNTLKRRKRVKKVRTKPRPGRVKGAKMEKLRRACYFRDQGFCQECGLFTPWEVGHLAHIRAKRNHGDGIDNVRWLCAECHHLEHQYGKSGVKPCPPKPRMEA